MTDRLPDPEPASAPAAGKRPPYVFGSLAAALVRSQRSIQTITLIVTTVVAIAVVAYVLPELAFPLNDAFGYTVAIWILGVVAWAVFVAAVAVIAFLPALLLRPRDRAVFATHSWIGAREVRRALGGASRTAGLPTNADAANKWLARTPAADATRPVRVEVLLLARRFDEARREADLLPEQTPIDAYRKRDSLALIADQTGEDFDEGVLRDALGAIPPGPDHIEAAVSLAVLRARRALPDGDWRAPLLEARPLIPGSDVGILLADFGRPIFEILVRKAILPFTVLMVLIALSVTVLPALMR